MEFNKVREILAELLKIDPGMITEDSFLADDLGADSLDLFQLMMLLEKEFGVETDDKLTETIVTVGDAANAIKKLTAVKP